MPYLHFCRHLRGLFFNPITSYISIHSLEGHEVLRDPKSQCPKGSLDKPEHATHHSALSLGLSRVYVSIQEERAEENPSCASNCSGIRVFQSGDQGEKHRLGSILKEIGMRTLSAVELLSLGLYDRKIRLASDRQTGLRGIRGNPRWPCIPRHWRSCEDREPWLPFEYGR